MPDAESSVPSEPPRGIADSGKRADAAFNETEPDPTACFATCSLVFLLLIGLIYGSLFLLRWLIGGFWWLLSVPATFLLALPLLAGYLFTSLKCAREQPPRMSDLFAGFARYWQVVGIGSALACIAAVMLGSFGVVLYTVTVISETTGESHPATIFISIVAIAVPVILGSRFALAPLICIDDPRSLGVLRCMRESWRTSGSASFVFFVLVAIAAPLFATPIVLFLTPALPCLAFPIGFGIAVMAYFFGRAVVHGMPARQSECRNCGYSTVGLSTEVCPECGAAVTAHPAATLGRADAVPTDSDDSSPPSPPTTPGL